MVTRCRVALLGGLRIEQGDRIITRFRTQKTGLLLAYLAYYREHSHPRDQLIAMLWPEADPASGRSGLSVALSSLRHQLEPPGVPHGAILRADRFSVQLNPDAVGTDAAELEAVLRKAAQAASTSDRMLFLADAAELYAGELLPGYYEEWCLTERDRLAGAYLEALHQLAELLEQAGDLDRALGYARRAASADPLREEGCQDLMRLLAAAGQPTAALRQYRALEQRLDEELGEEPSATIRELAMDIERQTTGPAKPERQSEELIVSAPLRPSALASQPPTGTVTFLLTDIERSTARWEKAGEAFRTALATHHTLLRRTFRRLGGYEFKEAGEGFLVAFERASDAVACAIAGQRALADHPWPEEVGRLGVRMALHTGEVELQEGDYHGLILHHASRIRAAAHAGQILCSEATAVLVRRSLEPGVGLSDLGVYRLRDVEAPERLFQVEFPGMPQQVFPPLRAEAGYARSLPLQFTRFVGREKELGDLEELLLAGPARLVTLTGPGGTGKSRLALELAGRVLERFNGAVWFVPLADLSDPHRIVDAVLEALRLPRSPTAEPLEQVVEMLSRQTSLLVLDNFEHLVAEGASFVQTLLERVPSLTCLVTSRQRLDLSGEREFVVPPLQTPAGTDTPEQLSMSESVQLFIDRAQNVRPDFQVTNQNAAALAELCSRLEGIPLAIELAAARAQVLTPAQMLHQLARRFEFLVSRRRDGAKRHQTLHAAVEWSYRLLPPELQRFFARLSVFRGGWTLEAAEAVCEEPLALDYLAQLRECSLVLAEEEGDQVRFRMLETLREFAAEQLGARSEPEALRQRHAEFFMELPQRAGREGAETSAWLRRLEADHDNLRAALEWAVENDMVEAGVQLAEALHRFWFMRGHWTEGRQRVAALLATTAATERQAARAAALRVAGGLAQFQDDREAAWKLYEERLALWRELEDELSIAAALVDLGSLAECMGNHETARLLLDESLGIARRLEDTSAIADALRSLGNVAWRRGDLSGARSLLQERLMLCRRLEQRRELVIPLTDLGRLLMDQGDEAGARSWFEEAMALSQEFGDTWGLGYTLRNLGELAYRRDDCESARRFLEQGLAVFRELGHKLDIAVTLSLLGAVAQKQGGDLEQARSLHERSLAIRDELGTKAGGTEARSMLGQLCYLQGDLEAARHYYRQSLATWQEMDNTTGIAWMLHSLGLIANRQDRYDEAHSFLEESLTIRRQINDRWGVAVSLNSLSQVAHHQGDRKRAIELCREALALFQEQGIKLGIAQCLENLASVAAEMAAGGHSSVVTDDGSAGEHSGPIPGQRAGEQVSRPAEGTSPSLLSTGRAAARLFGAAERVREALGTPLPPVERADYDRRVDALRTAMGEEAFAVAWAEGRAMTLEQATAYALDQGNQA